MTIKKFNEITDHIWKFREYLQLIDTFDYPWYGGLKGKMGCCSPEAVDAMQNIWWKFQRQEFKTKHDFQKVYKQELKALGEKINES